MRLEKLGWNNWFEVRSKQICPQEHSLARVIIVDRDRYIVRNEQGEFSATVTGKFRYSAVSAEEYPCVGDWVCVQIHQSENVASLHAVLPRQSFLRRKSPGESIEFQMIGANIDAALIVQSCHFDFNVRRLERYLVMVNEGHIEPVIVLTKSDLIESDQLEHLISRIRNMGIAAKVIPVSNVSGVGLAHIRQIMIPGKTYCLVGSSGVGKTTLINHLIGNSDLETKAVSGTGEGRHTTVRRQLIVLEEGTMLIDTPGMRELGILGANEGIDDGFGDILELSRSCRFNNCTHDNESRCAVLQALNDGALDRQHYRNYLKIKKESEFYEMSYAEKRKKDKEFGKRVRAVMKSKGSGRSLRE